jgi:hypothetical protein
METKCEMDGQILMPLMPSGRGINYDNHGTIKSAENSYKKIVETKGKLIPKNTDKYDS